MSIVQLPKCQTSLQAAWQGTKPLPEGVIDQLVSKISDAVSLLATDWLMKFHSLPEHFTNRLIKCHSLSLHVNNY